MKKKNQEYDVTQNPLYHDTWKLLRKYRDVVWSLELSVQQVRSKFQIEYGSSIEDFLESIYLAGADLSGSEIEHHARFSCAVAHELFPQRPHCRREPGLAQENYYNLGNSEQPGFHHVVCRPLL